MRSSRHIRFDGGALRILNVLDEHTREALGSKVARSIGSESVRKHLERLFATHGKPKYIRADNGREFIGEELKLWLKEQGVTPIFIEKVPTATESGPIQAGSLTLDGPAPGGCTFPNNALADPPVRICFTPFGTWSRRRAHRGRYAATTAAEAVHGCVGLRGRAAEGPQHADVV